MAERAPLRRILIALTVALLLLVGALYWLAGVPLNQARELWRAGQVAEAIEKAESWSRLHIRSTQYHQMLAIAYLSGGQRPAAKTHLDALRGRRVLFPVVPKDEVARRLFARGQYADFLSYDEATSEMRTSEETTLYRAAALAVAGRLPDAEATLREVDRGEVDEKKIQALERAIAQRKEGYYLYVTDRAGGTIARMNTANGDLQATTPDFAAIVEKEAGPFTFESRTRFVGLDQTIETTLDPAMQKVALRTISGFRASLVAIDPKTNEILALASNPPTQPLRELALSQQYEPGSVVKVLTALNAIENEVDLAKMFPYQCNGDLLIDGRHFGDWLEGGHGRLENLDEAMALSCNVVFADLGLRVGRQKLESFMRSAGFGGDVDLGVARVPLGRNVGALFNNFETAFYAIGLEHETSNTLHAAMLASMLANHGKMTTPTLIRNRRSILGDVIGGPPAPQTKQIASAASADRVVQAMRTVVTHPRGTGRRAAVDGVTLALKTGTAGKRENGYHALILGFAPADVPRVAFAIVIEDSGPAEFVAAKMAHDFVSAVVK